MTQGSSTTRIVPVIPSSDIQRDLQWYEEFTDFRYYFGDEMYSGIRNEELEIHLQWHADTPDDPMLSGSVVKIFVKDIQPYYKDYVDRGTIHKDKLLMNTPWGTHEFGFYDLNRNAFFFVQDVD